MKNRVATLTAQMVGRTPWSARDDLVPLPSQRYHHHAERQQADGGVGRGPGVRLTRLRGCGFSTLLGWAFRPRNFMKKGGAGAFACQNLDPSLSGWQAEAPAPPTWFFAPVPGVWPFPGGCTPWVGLASACQASVARPGQDRRAVLSFRLEKRRG